MSIFSRVLWQEGMFLRAQHFQQQERWVEHALCHLHGILGSHMWGLREMSINIGKLAHGTFKLERAAGIFADGTLFSFPQDDAWEPPEVELNESCKGKLIYLALAAPSPTALQTAEGQQSPGRLKAAEINVADCHSASPDPAELTVGRLGLQLMNEGEDRSGFQCIPIARIRDITAERRIELDELFLPPSLTCRLLPPVSSFLSEFVGMLAQLGDELAGRLTRGRVREVADQTDFLVLQTVNRWQPLLKSWAATADLHPERLYDAFVQIAGEWATFTDEKRRAASYSPFNQGDLAATFAPVIADLRRLIPSGIGPGVTEIPLVELRYGVRKGVITDRALLRNAAFYLVVRARMPADALCRLIATKAKIGPIERMPDLVSAAVSGIHTQFLQQPPRQLPFLADAHYFALDRGSPLWPQMENSAAFGFHVSDEPPEMHLQLWAVYS